MPIRKTRVCALGSNGGAFGPTPGRRTAQLSASRQSFRLGLGRPVLAKSPAGIGPNAPLLQPKPQTGTF